MPIAPKKQLDLDHPGDVVCRGAQGLACYLSAMARAQATEVYEPSEVATLLREYADRLEKTPKAPSVAKASLRNALEAVAEAIGAPEDELPRDEEPAWLRTELRRRMAQPRAGSAPEEALARVLAALKEDPA
jgi:hypothetical protein